MRPKRCMMTGTAGYKIAGNCSHWNSQWEKNPHWESQWKSQDLDFWWGSWWGSWFLMRFLMRFLIINEVLAQDLIEISILEQSHWDSHDKNFFFSVSDIYILEVGMRRGVPLPAPVTSRRRHLPVPANISPPSNARRNESTYIKQMPLDTRSRDCNIKCRRDPARPRIADDSNSQNVNSRLFPVKSVSQSVTDHRDYYVNIILYQAQKVRMIKTFTRVSKTKIVPVDKKNHQFSKNCSSLPFETYRVNQ